MSNRRAEVTVPEVGRPSGSLPVSESDLEALLADAMGLKDGETPFPWQKRLLLRFLQGDVPRALDVATGLGKTATVAVWVVARSLGAAVPRRLVYVVDRRAVVDQATTEAERLREWVATRPRFRDGLGLKEGPLPVSTLRGQFVDNREWLEDPSISAILVGTVDMIGSRLLFEGYRASRKMRPYLAGLLGHDSLFVLDEAHLVPPFERLLERITLASDDLGAAGDAGFTQPPPPQLLSLSATGRSRGGEPFELDTNDLAHEVVQKRLRAAKRLTVETVAPKTELAIAAAERAWQVAGQGARSIRCIVFLYKRQDSEAALNHLSRLACLEKRKKDQQPAADVELLVGGRRVFERAEAAAQLEALGFLAGSSVPRLRPAFLFATSAGEVGVDLDADHMVCDLVAWERMVQRLGRVNRRGAGDASVVVLKPPRDPKEPQAAVARRAEVLALMERLPSHEDGSHDASPGALRDLHLAARDDSELSAALHRASTPEPLYPGLDRPTLDAWSMTSLVHHPGRPAVAPWLRGWVDDRPQTTVAWRRILPIPQGQAPDDALVRRFFEAAPLHASEILEAETFRVAEWLFKRVGKLRSRAEKSGGEGRRPGLDDVVAITRSGRGNNVTCWTLRELVEKKKEMTARVLPGADVIVDARVAGLSRGLLDPGEDEVPATLDGELGFEGIEIPYKVIETPDADAIEDRRWRERERLPLKRTPDGEVSLWLVVQKLLHDSATEEDRSAGHPQLLAEHQAWTADRARDLATRLGLSEEAERVLVAAARLHDEGKRAARWQAAFHAPPGVPHAKTRGPVNVHLLDGYRHEFGSLAYAEKDPEVASFPEEQRELVLHLISSHHGFARPIISTSGCEDAPPSVLEKRARSVAHRFWALQERWGPWGLAWWEALLRAADQQASRSNDNRDRIGEKEA